MRRPHGVSCAARLIHRETGDRDLLALERGGQTIQDHGAHDVPRVRLREHDAVPFQNDASAVARDIADGANAVTSRRDLHGVTELGARQHVLQDARLRAARAADVDDDWFGRSRLAVDVDGGCRDRHLAARRRVGGNARHGVEGRLARSVGVDLIDRGVELRGPVGLALHSNRDLRYAVSVHGFGRDAETDARRHAVRSGRRENRHLRAEHEVHTPFGGVGVARTVLDDRDDHQTVERGVGRADWLQVPANSRVAEPRSKETADGNADESVADALYERTEIFVASVAQSIHAQRAEGLVVVHAHDDQNGVADVDERIRNRRVEGNGRRAGIFRRRRRAAATDRGLRRHTGVAARHEGDAGGKGGETNQNGSHCITPQPWIRAGLSRAPAHRR